MYNNKIFNKYHLNPNIIIFIGILSLYLILGIVLFKYYQHKINPDAINYVNIAKYYFLGNYTNAINTYWSPLISWLLIPFFIFGTTPVYMIYSTKVLSLIIGFFTIIGVRQLSYKFEIDETIRISILLSVVPITLYFVYSYITPDLLVVCIFVYYFNIIFNPKYPEKLSYGLLCGLLGALAYFAKSYAFPFFIVHFILFNFIHYFKNVKYRKNTLKNLFLGFLLFFAISGIWMGVISQKEGALTYGTSGEFNHNLMGPDSSKGWTTQYLGESSVKIQPWSPFSSWYYFKYQLNLILTNTLEMIDKFELFSYLSIIILLSYLLFFIKPIKKILNDDRFYPFLTVVIFCAGYSTILVEERYLWIIYILLLLMGGYLLNKLFKSNFFSNRKNILLLTKIIILPIFMISFVMMPISFLHENVNADADVYNLSNTLETQYNIHGNIASDDNERKMLYISYYLGTKYLGQTKKENITELQKDLSKNNINFYFVWNNSNNYPSNNEITGGKIKGLKIYHMT